MRCREAPGITVYMFAFGALWHTKNQIWTITSEEKETNVAIAIMIWFTFVDEATNSIWYGKEMHLFIVVRAMVFFFCCCCCWFVMFCLLVVFFSYEALPMSLHCLLPSNNRLTKHPSFTQKGRKLAFTQFNRWTISYAFRSTFRNDSKQTGGKNETKKPTERENT